MASSDRVFPDIGLRGRMLGRDQREQICRQLEQTTALQLALGHNGDGRAGLRVLKRHWEWARMEVSWGGIEGVCFAREDATR